MAQQQSTSSDGALVREIEELRSLLEISRFSNQKLKKELQGLKANFKRMESEKELVESENYKELVENARTIILKIDRDGICTYFNEFAQSIFGYKPEEIIGKNILGKLIPYKDSKGNDLAIMIKKILENPDNFSININENLKKNGERFWVEWRNRALLDNEGNQTGHIAVGQDITERINSEKFIQEAKEKLEVALEIGYIGIWEWNLRSNEVTMDKRMENMFGIKPGKFDGTHLALQNSINDEDLTHFKNALNLTIRSDMPFETIIRTKPETGAVKYIFIKAILKKDEKDRPANLHGVCFDVTSMRRGTEHALMKLNEELLRSNKELKQFAYVASHDLQEPLRMVSSFTQMLAHRYGDKLDDNARDYIRFAVEGSKRMYDLLNGLLAYSRVQTRGQEFTKVKMNSVLEKVIQNLNLKITEKNASVHIRRLPVIHADESQMIQLFQNLIDNSIKFSTRRPKITISANSDDDYYVFTVRDDGIGIDPQYFEKIFKIFQRLHTKEEYEGTGIGLAICKRIVERHGGSIRVESQEGKGAAFVFSIARAGGENI